MIRRAILALVTVFALAPAGCALLGRDAPGKPGQQSPVAEDMAQGAAVGGAIGGPAGAALGALAMGVIGVAIRHVEKRRIVRRQSKPSDKDQTHA